MFTNPINHPRRRALFGLLAAGVVCCGPAVVSGQTVTVDPGGTPDGTTIFTDLQTAVASFAVGGTNAGNAAENVINVRNNNGPVGGSLNADSLSPTALVIDEAITIQGVDASDQPAMAVFAAMGIANDVQTIRNFAFPAIAWQQEADLTLRDLAVIPALSGQILNSFIVARTPSATPAHAPVINIENCVFSGNDGTNQPITTTGRPEDDARLDLPGARLMDFVPNPTPTNPDGIARAAGMWIFSNNTQGTMTVNVKDTVFASVTPLTYASPRFEVVKSWLSGPDQDVISCFVNFNEGCVIANLDGNLAQVAWGSMVNVNGTHENPVVVRKLHNSTVPSVIWMYFAPGDNQPVACSVNHAHFYDIASTVIREDGILQDGSRAFINSITNSVFANTGNVTSFNSYGALDTTGIATPEITVDGCVFHNAGIGPPAAALYARAQLTRPVNISNSVFTSGGGHIGVFNTALGSVFTVSDSTLSLEGANPLQAQTGGDGPITLEETVDQVEVNYVNMDDPFEADFFQVVDDSKVGDWSVY